MSALLDFVKLYPTIIDPRISQVVFLQKMTSLAETSIPMSPGKGPTAEIPGTKYSVGLSTFDVSTKHAGPGPSPSYIKSVEIGKLSLQNYQELIIPPPNLKEGILATAMAYIRQVDNSQANLLKSQPIFHQRQYHFQENDAKSNYEDGLYVYTVHHRHNQNRAVFEVEYLPARGKVTIMYGTSTPIPSIATVRIP